MISKKISEVTKGDTIVLSVANILIETVEVGKETTTAKYKIFGEPSEMTLNNDATVDVLPAVKFIYLSLKWTHKKDKWFTMYRTESKGYVFWKEDAGIFTELLIGGPGDTISIPLEIADQFFVKEVYEGTERTFLPNTAESRKAFGITLESLKCRHPYKF